MSLVDFDDTSTWLLDFDRYISRFLNSVKIQEICRKNKKHIECYYEEILETFGHLEVFRIVNLWVAKQEFLLFHATRLREDGRNNVELYGLKNFQDVDHWQNIKAVIQETSRSDLVDKKLDLARKSFEKHQARDNEAIFFGLSKKMLLSSCAAHYLTFGSETQVVILGESAGHSAKRHFLENSKPYFVAYSFLGQEVSQISHVEKLEDILMQGNTPSFERHFFERWVNSFMEVPPNLFVDFSHLAREPQLERAKYQGIHEVQNKAIALVDRHLWN